jgi:hypothetical protein
MVELSIHQYFAITCYLLLFRESFLSLDSETKKVTDYFKRVLSTHTMRPSNSKNDVLYGRRLHAGISDKAATAGLMYNQVERNERTLPRQNRRIKCQEST